MDSQNEQELINKFGQISLGETDDDNIKSLQQSPQLDERLTDILLKLPSMVKQTFETLGPLFHTQLLTTTIQEGTIFLGNFTNGQKQGQGYQIWDIGNLLQGYQLFFQNFPQRTWIDDKLEGLARMIYQNGDIFECNFHQGIANGFGYFRSQKKLVKGMWFNNVIHGEAQEIKADGTKYYGYFQQGIKQGKGLLYFKDSCKYEGQFRNNKMDGAGIFYWSDNSTYVGEFKSGIIQGQGTYYNSNGQILQGYKQFNLIKIYNVLCLQTNTTMVSYWRRLDNDNLFFIYFFIIVINTSIFLIRIIIKKKNQLKQIQIPFLTILALKK
ncbi:hypothetical protein pb186bvf_008234 [Paramecium bursaria]